jgi:hypothetical protein
MDSQGAFTHCMRARGWLFRDIETALFAGLAVLLVALTVWWVRHRLV